MLTESNDSIMNRKFIETNYSALFNSDSYTLALIRFSDCMCVEVNNRFSSRFDYSSDDVFGLTPVEFGLVEDNSQLNHIKNSLMLAGSLENHRIRLHSCNGSVNTCTITAKTVHLMDEKCILLFILNTDTNRVLN